MSQSKIHSIIESVINVVLGNLIALATQIVVFPLFGFYASIGEHLMINLIFAVVSIVRMYVLRRIFNYMTIKDR